MSYTALAITGVIVALAVDLLGLRTRLVLRRVFWVSYAIMFSFQLLTNGVLTGRAVVRYDGSAIIGGDTPDAGPPPFLGEGRIAYAPVEDLLFGFALILITLATWVWLGRRGVQYRPTAGPPIWRRGTGAANRAQETERSGPPEESARTRPDP